MAEKVWFITGSSRGFGRVWVKAALERGDKVVATARDLSSILDYKETYGDAVLPLSLDVTDRGAIAPAVGAAIDTFGRLDVLVNNAGYGSFGAVEEVTEEEARAQMETNFFGADVAILKVVDASEPPLRIFLGTVGLPLAKQKFAERLATWEKWADVSNAAQEKAPPVTV